MNRLATTAVLFGALMTSVPACSAAKDSTASSGSECSIPIDRFKELMVVEPSVINDARSRNDLNGPWSYRHAVSELVPPGGSASKLVEAWLGEWTDSRMINGFAVNRPDEGRAALLQSLLTCPWLQQTPANGCDATCSACAAREFDLAKAPFRLLAIVNRMDLRTRLDTKTAAGESRFVFGLTHGPADDPASKPMAMTLIFEYALPVDKLGPRSWAEQWHALASHSAFDDAYKQDLEALTERFAKRDPVSGSALSQVRTNESAFQWFWQLREFRPDDAGFLRLSPVANTPDFSFNGSKQLADYVNSNAAAINGDTHVVPPGLLGGSSDLLEVRWTLPNVDEPTRRAFARQTCNGCHSGENPTIDVAFHISPYAAGSSKLSQFLNNPQDPKHDELANREQLVSKLLCEPAQ